ncbi:MAG: hypothetical protein CMB80_01080 [Flammeovirgaceae bacterium]|nr:hypothetical protein [Flammeovirgaceae bacterium]|tara:strand:+ start:3758 stop:4423 length:666 start_codon:yes stop_codon:yes gene_type:complete
MCTPQNESIVSDVIDEFVDSGKPFTAFDVTSEAKKRGATERHVHLKGVVHARYGNGQLQSAGYNRTLVDIGTPVKPWLYYLDGTDHSKYESDHQVGSTDVDVDIDTDSNDDQYASTDNKNVFVRKITNANRLSIPTSMSSRFSNATGAKIGVYVTKGKIFLVQTQSPPDGTKLVGHLTVDVAHRIRISEATFQRADMLRANNGMYKIAYDETKNQVEVTVA